MNFSFLFALYKHALLPSKRRNIKPYCSLDLTGFRGLFLVSGMDFSGDNMEIDGVRARSFRYEDYNNRRAFLRSYPLHWQDEEEAHEDETVRMSKKGKSSFSVRLLTVFHWEDKVLLLRKLKHKVAAFYLVACHPFGFKSTTTLISV